jgi:hypothetical protein
VKPYTKSFEKTFANLRENYPGWDYLFLDEKVSLTLLTLSMLEEAYDEAFASCEEQDSGFPGTTTWTNHNPYRKDPDVLDIITDVQRNLR